MKKTEKDAVAYLHKNGFTLIEILIVIAIISIVFALVILILNPEKRISSAYNAQRVNDSFAIEKAIQQYYIDHQNYRGVKITSAEKEICDTRFVSHEYTDIINKNENCDDFLNLSFLVPVYLVAIPTDPLYVADNYKNRTDSVSDEDFEKMYGSGYLIKLESGLISVYSKNMVVAEDKKIFDANSSNMQTQMLILIIAVILSIFIVIYVIKRHYIDKIM